MNRAIYCVASRVRSAPRATKELTDAFTYCVQVVRTRDFENYIWCTQLPKELRPGIFALRAFHVETASVVERAGQGNLFSQMRFQWWLDAISNLYKHQPPSNPIFKALFHILQTQDLTRYRLRKIIQTRRSDALRDRPFETISDLEEYADGTAAQLMCLQLEAAGVQPEDSAAQKAAELIGRAVGLTNVLRGTSHHASKGSTYFPKQLMEQFQVEESRILTLKPSQEIQRMTEALASRALDYLTQARTFRAEIQSPSTKRVLLPATVAETYLKSLRRYSYDLFSPALQKHTDGLMLPKLQLLIKWRTFLHRF